MKFLYLTCLLLGLYSSLFASDDLPPNNIILLIGDGMGVTQLSAGKVVNGHLNMERFKHLGLLTTFSNNNFITDSAAAATAMATGYKTDNGVLSLSPEGKPFKTIIEYAQEGNKATGLVATSSITHATPAAFAVHVSSRKKHLLIAEQLAQSGIDVLLGGGWGYFVPSTTSGSKRWDNKNLFAQLATTATVIQTAEEFNTLGNVNALVGLFAVKHLPKVAKRQPTLAAMTKKALSILAKNNNGFFLMVEGSQIDWGGHANDQDYMISELIDFDQAVGVALDFAQSHPDTLVIATSDHETGGFAIHEGSIKQQGISDSKFTRDNHTATMVPVFAYGARASDFSGISDNTQIGENMIHYFNGISSYGKGK